MKMTIWHDGWITKRAEITEVDFTRYRDYTKVYIPINSETVIRINEPDREICYNTFCPCITSIDKDAVEICKGYMPTARRQKTTKKRVHLSKDEMAKKYMLELPDMLRMILKPKLPDTEVV